MKTLTQAQRRTLDSIRNSKGRFFGLYTKQGEVLNAQFVAESPQYIEVYDRNNFETRKFAKTSIARANLG